jgi:hypothetical protein
VKAKAVAITIDVDSGLTHTPRERFVADAAASALTRSATPEGAEQAGVRYHERTAKFSGHRAHIAVVACAGAIAEPWLISVSSTPTTAAMPAL